MANNNATTNLKLILPVEENINWAGTINENFKTIDDAVGEIETKYTTLINRNIDNAAIFIDDKVTAVNFANKPDINKLILGNITASGFALADNNNEIPSDQYVNFAHFPRIHFCRCSFHFPFGCWRSPAICRVAHSHAWQIHQLCG